MKHHYRITIDFKTQYNLSALCPVVMDILDRLKLPDWIKINVDDARAERVINEAIWGYHKEIAHKLLTKIEQSTARHKTPSTRRLRTRIDLE